MKISINGTEYPVRIRHFRILDERALGVPESEWNKRIKKWSCHDVSYNSIYPRYRDVFPRGGITIAETTINGVVYEAASICSINDNFNKRLGRELAIARLKEKIASS